MFINFIFILKLTRIVRAGDKLQDAFTDVLKHTPETDLHFRHDPGEGYDVNLFYTHITPEIVATNYKRLYRNSYTFRYIAESTFNANLNFFSLSEDYHPQLAITEMKKGHLFEVICLGCKREFQIIKNRIYLFEIGYDHRLMTGPFKNKKKGGFALIISSVLLSLEESMSNELVEIAIHQKFGTVTFKQDHSIVLHDITKESYDLGKLKYNITPYYNASNKTISFYYIDGSHELKRGKQRSTIVQVSCKSNKGPLIYYGNENSLSEYFFEVDSKNICMCFQYLRPGLDKMADRGRNN